MRRFLCVVAMVAALGAAYGEDRLPIRIYAAGDIAQCEGNVQDATANKTAELIPVGATVVTLGDSVYPLATAKYFASCYAPTWGRHFDHTIAVPGNHDYVSGRLTEFAHYFGPHTDPKGYFMRRIGSWLLIGLDSNQSGSRLTQQFEWLRKTLAEQSSSITCIAAFWHHALFSSGLHSGDGNAMRPAWQMLYEAHADIVMSGHEHFYERFDQLNAHGSTDQDGVREFVVGTGGATLYGIYRPSTRNSVRRSEHGVLALDLARDNYSWEFLSVDHETLDHGRTDCHRKSLANDR